MTGLQWLDAAAIDEARAAFKARFPVMAGYYFEDAAGYVEAIRQAVRDGHIPAIIGPAVILKSSSRQMGASGMCHLAAEVERHAREAVLDFDEFARHVARLEKALERTRAVYPTE